MYYIYIGKETNMENLKTTIFALFSLTLLIIISGSGEPVAPNGHMSSIQTLSNYYTCHSGSPAAITKNGDAILNINVRRQSQPAFNRTYNLNYQSSHIDCGSTTNCCITIETPVSYDYDLVFYFNINPCTGYSYCERRYHKETISTNSSLDCVWDIYSITDPNPNGLTVYGGC